MKCHFLKLHRNIYDDRSQVLLVHRKILKHSMT